MQPHELPAALIDRIEEAQRWHRSSEPAELPCRRPDRRASAPPPVASAVSAPYYSGNSAQRRRTLGNWPSLFTDMTPAQKPVPSLSLTEVARTLRVTTEVLAAELAQPGRPTPQWSESQWRVARASVAIHGIAGLLAQRSGWQGPHWWRPFLESQRREIAQRLSKIEALLRVIEESARAADVRLVALKGAALHARGLYPPGTRPMADLDLLVSAPDQARAASLLGKLGFALALETSKHQSFEMPDRRPLLQAFGEDASRPVKIELHTRVREQLPLTCADITVLVQPPATAPAGLHDYGASHGLFAHLLLHAAGSLLWRSVRLLQLHDLYLLSAPLSAADWDALLASVAPHSPWWMYPPLLLTDRYYRCVPAAILQRLAQGCRWWLRRAYRERRICDVSMSNLWISTVPGIEWARSTGEMMRYARQQIWPSAAVLAERKTLAASQPLVSGGTWAEVPRNRRMLRRLLARQPRQESLEPVRAALRGDPAFTG